MVEGVAGGVIVGVVGCGLLAGETEQSPPTPAGLLVGLSGLCGPAA